MRYFLFIFAFILGGHGFGMTGLVHGQTMVGLSKEKVIEIVKKEHKEFHKDDSVLRQRFNYLKYVNGIRTKTWIIYFDDQDICRTSKVIYDYSYLKEVQDDLNSRYKKTGDLNWEFLVGYETILVELIKQEWYFTIRETRKNQELQ